MSDCTKLQGEERVLQEASKVLKQFQMQGFPQEKIIAGRSVFIAGHMAISGLIFSIF